MNFIIGVIGAILLIGGVAFAIHEESFKPTIASLFGAALILFASAFTIIPSGYTGVKASFGQIQELTLQNGFNWKRPFIDSIELVNNKQQDLHFADKTQIWGETSEKIPVYMSDVTVTIQIDNEKSAWIYANVSDYKSQLVSDAIVASSLKNAAEQFPAEEVTVRSNIENKACEELQASVDAKYGENVVHIKKVVINDMNFEASYNEAINQKNLAQKQQEAQAIQNQIAIEAANKDAEVKRVTAEAEADAKVTQAQGEADAIKVKADAEAEANQKLSQSLTDSVLQNKFYEKWNGQLPTVTGSNSALIDMPVQ